ncbi:MAG: hypothetical protein CVV22_09710 [Ignavibacteriae bacterium HGW-Ignavibacteriae-1]|jgi:membrane-bound lytic murein transglycosylase B|nr:MAG: hypothetical protein CVV22_09710 [Ignavibacteriae bacterium HGW-Ignavibacteriae-1]
MFGKGKYITIAMVALLLVLSSSKIMFSTNFAGSELSKSDLFKPLVEILIERGIDTNFLNEMIYDTRTQFDEKYVKINVTGFLTKADYSSHYNNRSVGNTVKFLGENMATLQLAEMQFGVPKEVIASILWIETRHGSYLGNHHITSVYLSTAMCNQPEYIELNIENLQSNFEGSDEDFEKLKTKILERSDKKANWAIDQLLAMEKVNTLLPNPILDIRGSWAGAFGISQFLPSSFVSWAIDGNGDGVIDLFNTEDAIFSVANYLVSNGWGIEQEQRRAAVFHYNNSSAYVDAVLKLADLAASKFDDSDYSGE